MHGPPRTGRKDGLDIPGHAGPDGRTDWTYRVTADRTDGRTGYTGSLRTGRKDELEIPGHRGPDGRTDWTYRVTADRTEGHTGSPRTLMEGLSSSRVSNTMNKAEMPLPSVPLKGTAQFNVPLHSNIKGYL